jgi:P-type conjugative transfer protein TrbL
MTLDPASFNFIQNYFIQRISAQYQTMIGYANNLLYIFAVIEITFFGLMWALQKKSSFDQLFLKGLKICFIFFIVTNFPYLCKVILESFAQMGGIVGATKNLTDIIFNPALLWKYGYDPGVNLLKIATESYGIGLPLLYLVLGLSVLLTFGLFIIQIILQILGFYFISFTALIALPLGVFTPTADMFTQALTNVLKAGVRVMVIIIITGIAVSIWNLYDTVKITQDTSLNPILGLLFSGLLFLYLARYLPRMAANTIGRIFMREPQSVQHENNVSVPSSAGAGHMTDGSTTLAAAAMGHPNDSQASTMAASLTNGSAAPSVSVTTSTSHRAPLNITSKALRNQLMERQTASSVMDEQKQLLIVSEKQLEHIRKALVETLKQQADNVNTTNEEFDDENWRTTH